MAVSMQALAGAPRSKTVYLGAAVLLITYLGGDASALEPLVTKEHMEIFVRIAGYLLGGAVIVVRFVTGEPLEAKTQPKD